MEGDPVAFAIRDSRSLVVAAGMAAIFVLAMIGVGDFLPSGISGAIV